MVTLVQETAGWDWLETSWEREDDCNDAIEESDFGKDVMESDLGAEERDLGADKGGFGADKGGFDTEEKSFGLDENDLKGSGTRWEAGLLMHSQHLQMQTCTNIHWNEVFSALLRPAATYTAVAVATVALIVALLWT